MGLDVSHYIRCSDTSESRVLEYFTHEELAAYPEFIQRNKHLFVEMENGEFGRIKVLTFKEVGYQRKGMNSKFYKDFQCGEPYIDLESVKRAFQYLQADHINSFQELKKNFQRNFIENFVEGESIFYASW